jgi:hypothetical protein
VRHVTPDDDRPVDEDLLGLRLADPVTRPVFRGVAFIPLESLNVREELRDESHSREYTPMIYRRQAAVTYVGRAAQL